jgi:exodeoxyribonuclease-5
MVSLGKKYTLPAAEGANFDQIICGYNKTRRDWNNRVRRIKKFENALSVKDKLICLKNNKDLGIFNGMQGSVTKIYKNGSILFDNGHDVLKLDINYDQFFADKLLQDALENREVAFFDYGYCITCHKAQGDEWDSVCVLEEKPFRADGWDQKRWAYTAASRAKSKLLWCV